VAFPPSPHMARALALAADAARGGEVPVGAVIVAIDGQVIAEAANATRRLNDPTAHAELLAIRLAAARVGADRLIGASLHVTLEPCAMCAGAIGWARIARLYYGAADPKGGAVAHGPCLFAQPTTHHAPEIYGGIGETEAAAMLRGFFAQRREFAA